MSRMMRTGFHAILLVSLMCAPAYESATQEVVRRSQQGPRAHTAAWAGFRSPAGDFTVSLPGAPIEATQQVATDSGTVPIRTYQVMTETAVYQISRSDLPEHVGTPTELRELYDDGRDTRLEDEGVLLIGERDIRLGGYPGREVTLSESGRATRIRWFMVGTRLYEVTVAMNTGQPPAMRAATLGRETIRFLDTFRLMRTRSPRRTSARKAGR